MTALRDREFATSYDKAFDDIAGDFYLPCMAASTQYDRITGYFSSAIFSIAWPALKDFVAAGGQMRMICSPVFSSGDIAALQEGSAALSEAELGNALVKELELLLSSARSRKPTQVLAGLIAAGVLDIRIAVVGAHAAPGDKRLFHDKVGLFTDADGDTVGFRGSMNETYLGLAPDGNLESIDVFPSWCGGRDAQRVSDARTRFQLIWDNEVPAVTVRAIPESAATLLREASHSGWEVLIDEVVAEAAIRASEQSSQRSLRDHQIEGLAAWELHDRRGLLEHATGSGKTFTAITAIRTVINDGGTAIVLVPSELLLQQWNEELSKYLDDLAPQLLFAGAGHDRWRNEDLLGLWTAPRGQGDRPRIVVAMMPTASTDAFQRRVARNDRLLVVADEAHRLGSPGARSLLQLDVPWRLGLSATPVRAGDLEGTQRLLDYFGGVLQPPYTLFDAIRDRVLTPYNYIPHRVELEAVEQRAYEELSRKMRREAGRRANAMEDLSSNEVLRKLAIARARILKRAAGKVPLAADVLRQHFQMGQKWLVYCDGVAQLRQVRESLKNAGLESLEYHSAMTGDRQATLAELEINGGILVSVRCLDEGVDLPAVSHALILASSRNPREFIQRRGRILRRYPGKALAFLHDAVVVPAAAEAQGREPDRLLQGELHRVLEFANGAANPQALTQIEALCIRYGVPITLDELVGAGGVEADETDDDGDEQ